jgi:hypothetical protein
MSDLYEFLRAESNFYCNKFEDIVNDFYENQGEIRLLSIDRRAKLDDKISGVLQELGSGIK